MVESIKILLLGVIVYLLSPGLFFRLGGRWFSELKTPNEEFRRRATILRRRFLRAVVGVFILLTVVLAGLCLVGLFPNGLQNWLRVIAAFLALSATLGRGGRSIETFPQETVVERIDRGMFVIAQVGTTVLLLVALGL